MALEDEVRELQALVAQRQRERARAEHEYDTAKVAADRAARDLHDEFGVADLEGAKGLLRSMEDQLRLAVDRVRAALDQSTA
jgi:F0F1-type ATP synthase membrane subunit b/b'